MNLSLGEGKSAPASQRQKLEQLSGFRAGPFTPILFSGGGRVTNRLSFILRILPKLGSDLPHESQRERGSGEVSWCVSPTAPSCSVSDPALRPASHTVLIFNNSFSAFLFLSWWGVGGGGSGVGKGRDKEGYGISKVNSKFGGRRTVVF